MKKFETFKGWEQEFKVDVVTWVNWAVENAPAKVDNTLLKFLQCRPDFFPKLTPAEWTTLGYFLAKNGEKNVR